MLNTSIYYKYMKLLLLTCICSLTGTAQLRLPTFFDSHMVLQQNTSNAIWGWARPGDRVNVSASWGEELSATADESGCWKVLLPTPSHRTDETLTVSTGADKLVLRNVAIGEVWLCLGQSNMGWALRNTFTAEDDLKHAKQENLRIYKSDRQHWHEPKKDCPTGQWKVSDAESAAATSAVSWYFGSTLQRQLNVPVGIIVQAYAGTPVEGWIPWEKQDDIARSRYHKQGLDEVTLRQTGKLGIDPDSMLKQYFADLKTYHQAMANGDTMKSKNKHLMAPIITKPAKLGNQYPQHIYNAMVHPLVGYGIRGIIWYQGERNSKTVQQALAFKGQLERLIKTYREMWYTHSEGHTQSDFYFSMTQLPSWGIEQKQPVEGVEAPWAVSRQMMLELAQEMENVGMVVSIDTGSPIALHPKNKKPIGVRHACTVLREVYHKDVVGHGPYYTSHTSQGNSIVLSFDGVGKGLTKATEAPLNSFAIAGADKKWHWAQAEIKGNTVVVSSPKVAKPVAVRYAWAMNPSQQNLLYNAEGFPASPFRTDNWDLYTEGAEEVVVNKPKKRPDFVDADWPRPAMQLEE
ncbi:hypothetical protein KEM09_02700 [Carboxylicivirga mesophila]|uniref:Sialate O-acetylesterase domain-containing protein n=1 Tax=Carboxylicivirga mesophila TaxID=1166478 RepID=A0ABS5K5N4_9BACT|nr:sialate O-acetylesterase [Carboxylicivirga mesophila]MBS2210289.1 hypothetical protein [Carboxylicivirga mesophila]